MIKITGLDKVIKKLDNLTDEVSTFKIFLQKLADIGVEVAKATFTTAQYDGVNDVKVTSQWINDNTIQIIASGHAVTFIEFGTGITYSEQHPLASEMGAIRGSFGKGKGSKSSWTYYGTRGTNGRFIRSSDKGDVYRTSGNPPARAMYLASKEIKQKILEVCKEVFL